VLREESEDVIVAASDMGLVPAAFDAPIAAKLAGEGGTSFRLMPHEHGTDGYFVASFVRTG
jgi:16S rRNA (cytosine967-C5)-methyltransferase